MIPHPRQKSQSATISDVLVASKLSSEEAVIFNGNAGAALKDENVTWKTLLASVVYALAIHCLQIALFLVIRTRFTRVYQPRTYLLPHQRCTKKPPDGLFTWLGSTWSTSDDQILNTCGLDALLFLRYLQTILRIFLPMTLIAVPILLPINRLSGSSDHVTSLKYLTISNVAPVHTSIRLWAHCTIGAIIPAWVCYVVYDELQIYIKLRQRSLVCAESSENTNTVLVGNIPKSLLSTEKLRRVFDVFHGGVSDVHINSKIKGLSARLSEREILLERIEVAETKLIASHATGSGRPTKTGRFHGHRGRATTRLPLVDLPWFPSLPFLGRKVDLIHELLFRFSALNKEISQSNTASQSLGNSAFIQFNRHMSANLACQTVVHRNPNLMSPRILGISPQDVIWNNLALSWRQRWCRACIGTAGSGGIIVLYALPVAFTSLLANLDSLADQFSWLYWITEWPDIAKSIVQGILPAAILQLILLLVPTIFRALVHFQGAPTNAIREIGVQNWHFLFLFVQVFLVVSISGSLVAFLSGAANDLKSIAKELAQTLPRASNYFMSYVLIKTLTGSASALLQPWTLFIYLLSPLLDKSPRQKWARQAKLANTEWARLFPPITSIAVIGISFSIVAPLVLAVVTFSIAIYWLAYRYNVLYVYQYESSAGGRFFVTALNHLFAGLYVMEVCMVGIFSLAKGPEGRSTCTPQALAMMVVLLSTAAYQYFLNRTYESLMYYLPITGGEETDLVSDSVVMQPKPALATQLRKSVQSPTIWIPQDSMGVSRDELRTALQIAPTVEISDLGAHIDDKGVVMIEACPPDNQACT